MQIVIDNREKSLIESCEKLISITESFKKITFSIENLELGDILIKDDKEKDILIIERKSISDLIASIKDGRYAEQSFRLNGINHENHNILYIIEGSIKGLDAIMKKTVYTSIFSLNHYKGFSTYRSESIDDTAYILLNMFIKLQKSKDPYYPIKLKKEKSELEEEKNTEEVDEKYCSVVKKKKNSNITVENFGEIVLCQIPSVSSVTAIAIMSVFKTVDNLIISLKNDSKCLDEITYSSKDGKKRKISKTCIKNILNFLIN